MLGVLDIQRVTIKQKIILAVFLLVGVFMFSNGRAHAATLNVSGGCTLPIAINSVNAGANQSGCTATVSPDGYGTNDTINIPAGTQTLSADLPYITASVVIQGAGISNTTVSGDNGQYAVFRTNAEFVEVSIKNLKITAFNTRAIESSVETLILENIEIDGQDAQAGGSGLYGIDLSGDNDFDNTIDATNVYVHDLNAASDQSGVIGIALAQNGGTTTTATFHNTTVASITNTDGDALGFLLGVIGIGTLNSTIINTTINNLSATGAALGFGSVGLSNVGSSTVHTSVKNTTVAGLAGSSIGDMGQPTLAFFTGGGGISPYQTSVVIDAENTLLANNLSDGANSNCGFFNLNAAFSYDGDVTSTINSLGHNLSDDNTCTTFNQTGDQLSLSNLASTLGPLQNNGGNVPTLALLPGSPAIAAGSQVLGITTDARGVARPTDCPSVGAYQFEGAVCAASTTNGSGSSGGAGNLADTGQNARTSILVGILFVSTAIATTLTRRKFVYKRR